MVVSHATAYRGRRQRVGTPVFSESGRLNYFLGYCPDCNGKCLVSPEEARQLMRRFGGSQRRPIQKIIVRILRKYEQRGEY